MSQQHPDTLYDLHKLRAQAYEQRAAHHRLLTMHCANKDSLSQKLIRLSAAGCAIILRFYNWQARQPLSLRLVQKPRRQQAGAALKRS